MTSFRNSKQQAQQQWLCGTRTRRVLSLHTEPTQRGASYKTSPTTLVKLNVFTHKSNVPKHTCCHVRHTHVQ